MTLFHLNGETGNVSPCRALKGQCPFGEENHYPDETDARKAFERTMGEGHLSSMKRVVAGVPVPERFYHVTSRGNLKSILEQGLVPAVGERSEELGEEAPKIYLFDSKASMEEAVGGWLGECFDEDEELVLLSVPSEKLRAPVPSFEGDDVSWEWTSDESISGSDLTVEPDDLG